MSTNKKKKLTEFITITVTFQNPNRCISSRDLAKILMCKHFIWHPKENSQDMRQKNATEITFRSRSQSKGRLEKEGVCSGSLDYGSRANKKIVIIINKYIIKVYFNSEISFMHLKAIDG